MNKKLIQLYQRVEIPRTTDDGTKADAQSIHALNTGIAGLGYTLDRDVMRALGDTPASDFSLFMSDLVGTLADISGASSDYPVLFNKFPYDAPDEHDYFIRRIAGMMLQHVGRTTNYKLVRCGHVIDPNLFNVEDYGACPICQFQIDGLSSPETIVADYQRLTPLKLLGLADGPFLTDAANTLLARQSSLSLDERQFLLSRVAQDDPPLTIPETLFREQVPIAWLCAHTNPRSPNRTFGEWAERYKLIRRLIRSATDVLRLCVLLSDPNGDLSLAKPVRFKLRTSQIKTVLDLLDGIKSPQEDMLRHAERWKKLALVLKPGTTKHRMDYKNAASAFDDIMRHAKDLDTFNRSAERLLAEGNIQGYAQLLADRPGEFMRKLDLMLRRTDTPSTVLVPMVRAVKGVPTTMLLTLRKYLMDRADPGPERDRVFRPKGMNNRIAIIKDERKAIQPQALNEACVLIERELSERFSRLPPMGTVWIDPQLDFIPLPANRRGDSSTSKLITKGMRWTVSPGAEVIRLFIWWRGNYDVDLSINLMNDAFDRIGHIGWTRLSGDECYHSGDIQNAPKGAAEFIDVPMEYLRRTSARYVAMSVISYRGETFDKFPCHAGFMERDAVKSGSRFEPESVTLKLDVSTQATMMVPLVFDLETRTMIYADLAVGTGRWGSAHGSGPNFAAAARAVIEQHKRSPTAGDVLRLAAGAAGNIVEDRDSADSVWTAYDLDWNAVYALTDAT